ncbi:hypothetical protein [Veillonella caviae]|uniref:hypothetical protein n=1 Tax=Veillonella caviae TaxID=248316 RepID=UPI0023F74E8F|nr:hypothetical protein [Veillonella caviae]
MYDKVKTVLAKYPRRYYLLVSLAILSCVCIGYIFYQPSGEDYQRTINNVERVEGQQRESTEYNQRIQRSIDRSTDYASEASERIERSQNHNRQIESRISNSQGQLNEARVYLERNAELYRCVEAENRARRTHDETSTNAAQPGAGSGCRGYNWSDDTQIER